MKTGAARRFVIDHEPIAIPAVVVALNDVLPGGKGVARAMTVFPTPGKPLKMTSIAEKQS